MAKGPAPWVSCMAARGGEEAGEKRESAMCSQTLRGAAVRAVWHGSQCNVRTTKVREGQSEGAGMTTAPAGRGARSRPSHSNLLQPRQRRKRPRKQADYDKRHRDKVKAAGGQDAWKKQRAEAAEEARSIRTAEEAAAEAKRMERKRKKAGYEKRYAAKVKAAGGQDDRALQREQRAQHAKEDLAFLLSRPKQTAEEAELEVRAFQAEFMATGREARALALQKQQEVDPLNRYVETEKGALGMAALVTSTLESKG
jgi:hypothetical protein